MRRTALVMVSLLAACADLGGLSGVGGATQAGPDAGGDTAPGDPDGGGACTTLYVSPAGDDAADGCSSAAPLRTIKKAIDTARSRALAAGEIHVCRGSFKETLRLDYPVSLVGSFDCGSWQQDPLASPMWAASTLVEAAADTDLTTLTITGAIGKGTRIEALEVDGPVSDTTAGTAAVSIEGASPTLLHDHVVGGKTPSAPTEAGSVGLYLRTGAGPDIRDSYIDGGRGVGIGTGSASMGLRSRDAGDVTIIGCKITGGHGAAATPTQSTVGLFVRGGKSFVVTDSDIDGGQGSSQGGGGTGVFVQMATTVQFVHDTISGGSTVSTATTTQKNVGLNTGGTAIVDRCRVFGGSGPADAPSETVAIDIGLNATGTVITNSAVHGGTARAGGGPATSTIGISLEGGTNHTIRWNSIYAGQPGTSAGANIGFVIAPGTKGVTIDDNLIFGDVRTNGFWLYECGTTLTSIQNNAFFSMPVALRRVTAGSTACDTLNDVAAVSDMVTTLAADFPALGLAGNFAVGVAACASPGPSCIGAVLAGWDAPTFGTQRFQSDGFALSPSVPCAIAKSVAAGPATTDLAGTARSAPFSLGANEAEACSP